MKLTRAEAWEILGGRNGPFGSWENWDPGARIHAWGQLPDYVKRAFWTIFAGQPECLPEPPPASMAANKLDPRLFIDMPMAVAVAKEYGLSKDELLAAIALSKIEGIEPYAGMKQLPRQPLLDWLEDQARAAAAEANEPVDYGLGTFQGYPIIDHFTLEDGTEIPVVDAPEGALQPLSDFEPPSYTLSEWWRDYKPVIEGWLALISIPILIWLIILIFINACNPTPGITF